MVEEITDAVTEYQVGSAQERVAGCSEVDGYGRDESDPKVMWGASQ